MTTKRLQIIAAASAMSIIGEVLDAERKMATITLENPPPMPPDVSIKYQDGMTRQQRRYERRQALKRVQGRR